MNTLKGNILDVREGIICHQVNCKGKMGAGLAKAIRNKFPNTYHDYMKAFQADRLKLGNIIISFPDQNLFPNLLVAHLCGQENYWPRDKVHTDYNALRTAISNVRIAREEYIGITNHYLDVYFPFKIGCGLAGGDWDIVSKIIEEELPKAIIVRL